MKIVLDVNIIISALIKDSITREILIKSAHEFYFPTDARKKLDKYQRVILNKSGLKINELEKVMEGIFSNITLVTSDELHKHKKAAKKIMNHVDSEDTIFIATALKIQNASIWSDDKHFDMQKSIQTFKTIDLVKLYREK